MARLCKGQEPGSWTSASELGDILALSITILVTDGEKVIAQAASELTTELHLKDFIEKTIPGFEETAKGLLQLTEKEVEQVVTEVETESKGWFSK